MLECFTGLLAFSDNRDGNNLVGLLMFVCLGNAMSLCMCTFAVFVLSRWIILMMIELPSSPLLAYQTLTGTLSKSTADSPIGDSQSLYQENSQMSYGQCQGKP